MSQRKHPIYTQYHALQDITVQDIRDMFRVFSRYYEYTSMEQFVSDLSRKTGAFIVRRKTDHAIVGFSTLGIYDLDVDGKKVKGFFSGDTIIESEYWGSRAINFEFVKRVVIEAFKHPFTRQYWFLISKGYKTFLLLTRNFPNYYPHPENENPEMKRITQTYCDTLFPGFLNREKMVLDFGDGYNCLKSDATPITPELRRQADIAFFEQMNPEWERGCELPCLAEVGLASMFRVILPQVAKLVLKPALKPLGALSRRLLGRSKAAAAEPVQAPVNG